MKETILPEIIPVFPLTGVLLLPGGHMPLHIFEARYRNMVADALEGPGMIGMIQPVVPAPDNRPPPDPPLENPELYAVGCLGRIIETKKMQDGRYMVVLKGEARFRVGKELPMKRGYRQVVADYSHFDADGKDQNQVLDSAPLLDGLKVYARAKGLKLDLKGLETITAIELLNNLAMTLPFGPAEKQGLLEALHPLQQADLLLNLMRFNMGVESDPQDHPPTLN